MPPSLRPRALAAGVLSVAVLLVSGCGVEAEPGETVAKPGSPKPAEHALRLYLDKDRCDLMSSRFAEAIDPEPGRARALCDQGRKPVDMLVRRGQYTIKDAELINGDGIIRVVLKDGGIRDYTLVPGGPDEFLVDQVSTTSSAEFGEPLRLQAREAPDAEAVDARITVDSLREIPASALSEDDYKTGLDQYYLLHVRIRSRSDKDQLLGSDGFQLATKGGYAIATPREMYSDIGTPLPGLLRAGKENEGDIFFAAPSQEGIDADVRPRIVQFVYGDPGTGTKLTWTKPRR